MGSSANSRLDARQTGVLVAATLWAILLLALAPGAHGEVDAQPHVDEDPGGNPYVAGELLVAYEKVASGETKRAIVRESGGRPVEDLPGRFRLVSFADIQRDGSEKTRERALQRKLEDLRDDPGVEAADYNHIYKASFVPDDARFGAQWGLDQARFPGAWNDARGTGATIAVVDSGIDQDHTDIGKIATQSNFVRDEMGINDRYGHGTHVAGIAAALTNNARGVAGGCPACKLLIARVLDADGYTDSATLAAGIDWSVDNEADVINLSLDGPANSAVEKAVNDASANGAVVVAAAGNQGTTAPRYPAAYTKAIAVSATNENERLAGFSSRGSWVDLAAPGTNILSTRAAIAGGGYGSESGTSEAAPFVSALAGLLASKGKTASEIRQRMQSTATDLGPDGKDPSYGHGRIDAAGAVP